MSALDDLIDYSDARNFVKSEARAELAQLRARLARLEQAVNEARPFVNLCSRAAAFEQDRIDAYAWLTMYPEQKSEEVTT